jgi:hypothetical protein
MLYRRSLAFAITRLSFGLLLAAMMPAPAALGAPTAQVPGCVVGNWRAVDVEDTFRAVFGQMPDMQFDGISGDILLSINSDSSYELRYDGFSINSSSQFGSSSFTMDGTVHGLMRENPPGSLVGNITDSAVTVTTSFNGTTSTNSFPVEVEEGQPAEYDCTLGRLAFRFSDADSGRSFSFNFERA